MDYETWTGIVNGIAHKSKEKKGKKQSQNQTSVY